VLNDGFAISQLKFRQYVAMYNRLISKLIARTPQTIHVSLPMITRFSSQIPQTILRTAHSSSVFRNCLRSWWSFIMQQRLTQTSAHITHCLHRTVSAKIVSILASRES